MSADPNLIRSIEAAVAGAPGDQALRLHLASLQLDAGRPQAALDHCLAVLNSAPNHPQALGLAVAAATAAGELAIAARFEQRLQLIGRDDPAPEISTEEQFRDMFLAFEPPISTARADDAGLAAIESPRITLSDVGGMGEVKQRLNASFLGPLRNPELTKMYGKSLRGGLLLYGPPGCGKTFIARAVAGELGAGFMSIGLTDVLDMWFGNSEHNLHQTFEQARIAAPCVLFLDEIDALGQKRSHLRHSAGRGVVNQLLTEMDGVKTRNDGLFILAASNHPWDIDAALRRPGRLDRSLLVLPPDRTAREAIVRYHLKERPVKDIDIPKVAAETESFSGADLSYLCETATEYALEDSLTSGLARPITMQDISRALKDVRPTTRAWFEIARNYAMFANDAGEYDGLLAYLREHRML